MLTLLTASLVYGRPPAAVDKCGFRTGSVRSQIFVVVKPHLAEIQPTTAIWIGGSTAGDTCSSPLVRFGSIATQQPSTSHSVTSINHSLPGISSATWSRSSWTTSTDLHLLALQWWAMVAVQFGHHGMLNALRGKGMLSEQYRAPAQIISSSKWALGLPTTLQGSVGEQVHLDWHQPFCTEKPRCLGRKFTSDKEENTSHTCPCQHFWCPEQIVAVVVFAFLWKGAA